MNERIYVIGHKNPDTDSICSAIGYAALKRVLGHPEFVAARGGEVGAEAQFLLDRFGLEAPEFLSDVKTKVHDVMRQDPVAVAPTAPLREVYGLLQAYRSKLAVVLREDGSLAGIVTNADLAVASMGSIGPEHRSLRATSAALASVLEGRLLCGRADALITGDVYVGAMSPGSMRRFVTAGAVVITGDRSDVQLMAVRTASCLIVTGSAPVGEDVCRIANERGIPVVVAPGDTYSVTRLAELSRAVGDVMNTGPVIFSPDDLLSDVVKQTREARHRVYPVVDEKSGQVVGQLYRDDIFNAGGQRVVMVDHNEVSQAVAGLDEARVLEVIDHHRLGDVQTRDPIFVRNEPVGSTATIVSKMVREQGASLPGEISGALLGAILSDTLVFRSPTCTEDDRRMAAWLAGIAGEDPERLGMEMLRAASHVEDMPAHQLIRYNLKEYVIAGGRSAIAQCEVVDIKPLLDRRDEILGEMTRLCEERRLSVMVMMFTEVLRRGTHLLLVGPERALVASAFGQRAGDGGFYLPGVLSRKMQVLPRVTAALGG